MDIAAGTRFHPGL